MTYILRDFIPEKDLPYFYKVHSDYESVKYYGMAPSISVDESKRLLESYISSMRDGQSLHKVICSSENNEYCGEIGLFSINKKHRRANSYCILLPKYRKKGISKAISDEFYKNIFSSTQINRIQAFVDSRNINAKSSLTGIGYSYEGRLVQFELENDEFIDIDVYALLKSNYESREQNIQV